MDNKQLVPINTDNDTEQGSVLVVNRKRRKRKFKLRRFLAIALLVCIGYFAYKNFSAIKEYANMHFNSSIENSSNNDQSSNPDDNDLIIDNPPTPPSNLDEIPLEALTINKVTYQFTTINNETSLELSLNESERAFILANEIYKQYGNEAPVVLVMHSNALESYSNGEYYCTDDSFYSEKNNVSSLGAYVCKLLNENNINAIHIKDVFYNGSMHGAKEEFENKLSQILKQYPSISYVIDISRDIIFNDDMTMNKPITEIDENNCAQIKLTVGSNSENDFWIKNINFANKFALESNNIIYDITLSPFELSQNISPISLKVDLGAYSNSYEEAKLASQELALRLSHLLYQNW